VESGDIKTPKSKKQFLMNCHLPEQTLQLSPRPHTLTYAWSAILTPQIAFSPSLWKTHLQDICQMSSGTVSNLQGLI
jgi:hypothetical protein